LYANGSELTLPPIAEEGKGTPHETNTGII
jgi:hypothetical protein